PRYLAHLDVPPADLSIAAGTLVRALAQDPVTWTSSRAGTYVEEQLLGWLTDLAYPAAQRATEAENARSAGPTECRAVARAAAAVRNAGLGDEALVRLPVDAHDRLRLDALDWALSAAERDGERVALVVLNAGTVGVGAIDPLREAILLAHRHGARVHVDAAH